jgi:2-hydroxy-3-oxopropionate reductase
VFEEIRPIVSSFARNMFLLGPVGSGSVAKACNQLVTMTGLITAVEGLELGIRHGLAVGPLQDAIMCSSGSARGLAAIACEYVYRTYRTLAKPRAALRVAVKDLAQVVELAREVGLRVELAEAALAIWRRAEAAGLGDADIYTIIDQFESRSP